MVLATLAVAALAATAAVAAPAPNVNIEKRSNFPPSYYASKDCKTDGPVSVCLYNKQFPNTRLAVTYSSSGYLWPQGSPLSAWVSVNGRGETFGLFKADVDKFNPTATPQSATYSIGEYPDEQFCYFGTTAENSTYVPEWAPYPRCPVDAKHPLSDGGIGGGSVGWYYNYPPDKDLAFLSGIQGSAWNVQVAVFNGKSNWDSKYGYNYRFTL
ncbi:hypothetical protein HDU96_009735 [Phlyctochytrium bullatum]|nr:hypothetical protein HDU96_009735 [Phlyctochytrium bullatum]